MTYRMLHISHDGSHGRDGVSWAGLATGPASWWLYMQINYALLNWACEAGWNPALGLVTVFAAISLAGAFSSWRAWGRYLGPGIQVPERGGHPGYLLCGLGVASGVLFAVVIVIQGIAAYSLDPCVR